MDVSKFLNYDIGKIMNVSLDGCTFLMSNDEYSFGIMAYSTHSSYGEVLETKPILKHDDIHKSTYITSLYVQMDSRSIIVRLYGKDSDNPIYSFSIINGGDTPIEVDGFARTPELVEEFTTILK